jgi:hypothetical protein
VNTIRRTLLAVGIAVPVSIMLAPHGGKSGIEGLGPFFSEYTLGIKSERVAAANVFDQFDAVAKQTPPNPFADLIPAKHVKAEDYLDAPDWAKPVKPVTYRQHLAYVHIDRVMIDMLVLQAIFAVIVNWRKPRERGKS